MVKFGQGSDVEGGDNLQSSVPACWDLLLPNSVFDLHQFITSRFENFCRLLATLSNAQ